LKQGGGGDNRGGKHLLQRDAHQVLDDLHLGPLL